MTKLEYENKIAELYERLEGLEQLIQSASREIRSTINMIEYLPHISDLKVKK